jgi:hypothetical protein
MENKTGLPAMRQLMFTGPGRVECAEGRAARRRRFAACHTGAVTTKVADWANAPAAWLGPATKLVLARD